MQAYRSSTWRSATLRERIPPPTGVVSGPLMATRCVRMVSSVASGSQFPVRLKAFAAPSPSSHSTWRLPPDTLRTVASNTRWAARQMSGPVPSPSMKGMMGRSGTTQRPSRYSMRSPMARQSTRLGRGCARRNSGHTLEVMQGSARLILFALAAACWLAAGPGGATTRALLVCHHHATHHAAARGAHHTLPSDGPCFCDEMTGGLDLALSTAVPTPEMPGLTPVAPTAQPSDPSLFPLPASPSFAPIPPPPNGLG